MNVSRDQRSAVQTQTATTLLGVTIAPARVDIMEQTQTSL